MMDLWKLFGIGRQNRGPETDDLGRLFGGIQRILDGHADRDVKLITGIAGLLGNVAHADLEISSSEVAGIRRALGGRLHLTEAQVAAIVELLLKHRVQLFAVESHIYSRLVNEVADRQQKIDLLGVLFSVAAADQAISGEEATAIRLVAEGLKLSHRDFVDARIAFKRQGGPSPGS
jgi:uncharacterized tellurite resistance protein B-like protein